MQVRLHSWTNIDFGTIPAVVRQAVVDWLRTENWPIPTNFKLGQTNMLVFATSKVDELLKFLRTVWELEVIQTEVTRSS